MRSRGTPLPLLLALSIGACAEPKLTPASAMAEPAAISSDAAIEHRLDVVFNAALHERRIVGGVLLVARDGQLVYHRAGGLADRERGALMREDTIFRLSSVSKPFVAATALALVEHGALGLEDPITRFLPNFHPRLADGTDPRITIRHLLTHTSGLGYTFTEPEGGPYHRAGVSDGLDAPGLSFDENARRLLSVPLRAAPNRAFHYSLSTDVLGEVIARASGGSLPDAVARFVTRPLGLRDTGFAVTDVSRLAVPYADGKPVPVRMEDGQRVPYSASYLTFAPSRVFDPLSYPSGGAGMVGTAHDVLVFLEALRSGGTHILMPATVRLGTEDQVGHTDTTELGPGRGFGFFGAIILDPARAERRVNPGTFRWGGAYGHTWFVDPRAKLTVVLLTNTTLEGLNGRLVKDVEQAIYGHD